MPTANDMTPERWQRIEQVYEEYLAHPPEARGAFLDRACDPALRRELESLLAAEAGAPDLLAAPFAALPRPDGLPLDDAEGGRIGPYRLLREIGHGGMGRVYLAEREEPFRQQVALKVIRHGLDTADALRRFHAERQILAALAHPHIAAVLDGGATGDGRPYLVMEYVEGLPITDYCDRHRLPVEDRLRLFRDVCAAVHAAHQRLVVHRDLKPSNILVTEDGTAKLLDFGIAKLLDPASAGLLDSAAAGLLDADLLEVDAPLTQTDVRVMTPEYAAPEQVRGEPVTTATDVYTLGVLLYELLTGRRPYRLPSRAPLDVARVICEEEPPRPSSAVLRAAPEADTEPVGQARGTTADRLRRRLSGDLDTVVLTAMRKEPERRYASAQELSDDLRRHLAGLPVSARPDTFTYRAGKFVRRHRLGVTAAAGLALLLVGFSTVTSVQSAEIRARAAEVALERDKAEQVAGFLSELFDAANPSTTTEEPTVRALLALGSERVEEELADQPAVQAALMGVMSRAHWNLGAYDEAERLARRSVAVGRTAYGPAHPEVIESMLTLAHVRRSQGAVDEAEALYREAGETSRTALGPDHPLTADAVEGLADVLVVERELFDEGEPLYREALRIRRASPEPDGPALATTLTGLADVLRRQRRFDEAEPLLREALALQRAAFGPGHLRVAHALNALAMQLTVTDDPAGAEPLYREALAIYRARLGDDHPYVATILFNLGRLLLTQEDYAGAEPLFREVLALRRGQLDPDHLRVASAALQLGRTLTPLGQLEEAEALLREALAIRIETLGADNWQIAYTEMELGLCLTARERYGEAHVLLRRGIAGIRAEHGPEHHLTQRADEALAHLYDVWPGGPPG